MYGSRVNFGLLAASAVMLSVLSLASPALGQDVRISGQPQTQSSPDLVYCYTSENCFFVVKAKSVGPMRTDCSTGAVEILAANDIPTNDGTPASGSSTGDTTTENGDDSSTDTDSGEFSGSSTPASPDLSIDEEKDLISGGWN